MRTKRWYVTGVAMVGVMLLAAACGSDDDSDTAAQDKGSLTVGAFNFTESAVLANIYKGALEADGYKVTVRPNLGSREIVAPAVEKGELQLYPGYAATDLEFYNNSANQASPDINDTIQKLRTVIIPKGLVALEPSPAIDINAFAVTRATADKFQLTKLSDLAPVANQLVLGGPPECPTRPFCQLGLQETYGLQFKEFKPVGLGPVADTALENGDVDVTTVLSTDGLAIKKGFVILEDDKKLQNADNVVPIMRAQAATPEASAVLNRVSAALTTADLAELNRKVDDDKEDPDAVAAEWLKNHGFAS
jgi:osmoprotectant transport system substrate-binding protein